MFKLAFQNLLSRKMRSLLSLLGTAVAIAGMVGLFSVSEGLNQLVSSTFQRIPGLAAMQPGAPIPLFSRIPVAWSEEIAAMEGVHVVSPEIWTRVNVIDGEMIISPPRFLFGADIPTRNQLKHPVYSPCIEDGRFLNESDRGTLNTCISRPVAEEFHKKLGDKLVVNGDELTIVGIYFCDSLLLDVAIIVDIDMLRKVSRFDADSVCAFYIEQEEGVETDELAARIREHFADRKIEPWRSGPQTPDQFVETVLAKLTPFLPPAQEPEGAAPAKRSPGDNSPVGVGTDPDKVDSRMALEVRSAVEWASRFDKFSADLDLFLVIITGIGVTVAVLSIVNTMLMSVSERIIEFGILKANGWSRVAVLKLITWESSLLGFGGGVIGCVLGFIGAQAINNTWPDRVQLFASPLLLAFSLLFSVAMGVIGGLYPAIWAMRMMPMDAIRRG